MPGKIIKIIEGDWIFSQSDKNEWLKASVPGCVHTDLLNNGKIEDPFYRDNERKLQWIDKVDWKYKCDFILNDEIFEKENIRLVFKGLDTHADIYLNEEFLFSADNMFREWKIDCKRIINKGRNQFKIIFHSPIIKGLKKLEELGFQPPAVNDLSEIGEIGNKKVSIFIRKAPYHFGWDWGPRLVSSGIWKPVLIEAWDDFLIEDVFYSVKELDKKKAVINVSMEIKASKEGNAFLKILDSVKNKLLSIIKIKLKSGMNDINEDYVIEDPVLWWSNGLGEPYLYQLSAGLILNERLEDEKNINFGIRTIKLIQKESSEGTSFYFELNGVPVFMKGADYIPNDMFPARVTKKKYDNIVQSAYEVGMNMLRVWGGGIYEEDYFYEICDKKGILIWQDFMFACSMYPMDASFENTIREEIIDNIKRLRNHPCIALWCGNNEIQSAWREGNEKAGWGWKQLFNDQERKILWNDYYRLFYNIIPFIIKELDKTRYYWPSSPISAYDAYDGDVKLTSGDVHYWGVWHKKEPFDKFNENTGRFMSEYGFQSFPQIKTISSFTLPEDRFLQSEVMASHQRSGTGNELIKKYMELYYPEVRDFNSLLYISQVLQAEGVKNAIESHRSKMPFCMGTLYWQLNDCWPVASWSSIDHYLCWKALHYYIKKAYGKYLAVPCIRNNKILIYIVSDDQSGKKGALDMKLYDFNGKILKSFSQEIMIYPNNSTLVYEAFKNEFIGNNDIKDIFMKVELENDGEKLSDNILYFTEPKNTEIKNPEIKYNVSGKNGSYDIALECNYLARNVYLDVEEEDGFFSDNYFDLIPGQNVKINYKSSNNVNDIKKKLKIISLFDAFYE